MLKDNFCAHSQNSAGTCLTEFPHGRHEEWEHGCLPKQGYQSHAQIT